MYIRSNKDVIKITIDKVEFKYPELFYRDAHNLIDLGYIIYGEILEELLRDTRILPSNKSAIQYQLNRWRELN